MEKTLYQVMDTDTFSRYMVSADRKACERMVKRLNNQGRRTKVSRYTHYEGGNMADVHGRSEKEWLHADRNLLIAEVSRLTSGLKRLADLSYTEGYDINDANRIAREILDEVK